MSSKSKRVKKEKKTETSISSSSASTTIAVSQQVPENIFALLQHACEQVHNESNSHGLSLFNLKIDDKLVPALCSWIPKLNNNIEFLSLENNQITSKGGAELFNSLKNSDFSAKKVGLRFNKLDDSCMKSLGEYLQSNQHIETISVESNKITDKGIEILAPYLIGNKTLKHLHIDGNSGITNKSLKTLQSIVEKSDIIDLPIVYTSILKKKALVVFLILNRLRTKQKSIFNFDDELNDNDIAEICNGMKKYGVEKLQEIRFSQSRLKSQELKQLLDTLKDLNSTIVSLGVNRNFLDDEALAHLNEFVQAVPTLKDLDISFNKFTEEGLHKFLEGLIGNRTLKRLKIYYGNTLIGDIAETFSRLIESSLIDDIDLNFSIIDDHKVLLSIFKNRLKNGNPDIEIKNLKDEELFQFCEAMQKYGCNKIKSLAFYNCSTSSGKIKKMFEILKEGDARLENLILEQCNIDDSYMEALGEYIEFDRSLTSVNISRNEITDKGVEILCASIVGNTSLKRLDISWNKNITGNAGVFCIEMLKKSCVNDFQTYGTNGLQNLIELPSLCKVPFEEREIPVESRTKSAAKTS